MKDMFFENYITHVSHHYNISNGDINSSDMFKRLAFEAFDLYGHTIAIIVAEAYAKRVTSEAFIYNTRNEPIENLIGIKVELWDQILNLELKSNKIFEEQLSLGLQI